LDATGEPGVLPLIQETLVLLWEKLKRRFLPLNAYELLVLSRHDYGATPSQPRTGLQVAIARRADVALANLGTEEKKVVARRVFLRLIQFGEGRPDTRRQQLEDDLRSFEDNFQQFDETLESLAHPTRRLLTFSGEERDQKRKVDIAHEALISGWPTLQQWISELREAEKTRRRLQGKAEEWIRMEKKGGLLDEAELPEAESWLSSNEAKVLGYDKSLYDLIIASREALEKIKREKEEQQQRELQLIQERLDEEKKAHKTVQTRNKIAVVFTIFLSIATVWIWKQKIQAQLLSSTYRVDSLKSEHQIDALIEGIKAGKILKNPLNNILVDPYYKIRVIATLSQQLQGINEKNVLQKHKFSVNSINFCHNGLFFVSGSDDDTIRFWNKNGEEKLPPLINDQNGSRNGYDRNVKIVSINSTCDLVASSDQGGSIKLWNLDGLIKSFPKSSDSINSIKFSPKGETLASASQNGMIELWDLKEGKVKYSWKAHEKPIRSISFSKFGDFLVSGGDDQKIKLWDLNNLNNNKKPQKEFLQKHQDSITEVTFCDLKHKVA
jgi:WD40 repeat protein